MTKKAVLVQRFLPHYRESTLRALSRGLAERGWDFKLIFGRPLGREVKAPWAERIASWTLPLRLGEIRETAMLMPTLLFRLARARPDVVVLEDVSGFPNNLAAAAWCRRAGKPYLVWGLGRIPGKPASRLRGWLASAIEWFYGGAAGFVCYSTHAMEVYGAYGKPVTLAPNACLPPHVDQERRELEEQVRRRGSGALKIATIGTLSGQKRVDALIRAAAKLSVPFELHVVGDGPARRGLERLAAGCGLGGRAVFHGSLYDAARKRDLLASCHVGVLPGRGGLAVQELLWHGLPVITGQADGTERDLVRDGWNGRLFPGFASPEELAGALEEFSALPADEKRRMSLNALETIASVSNTELMAAGVAKAVLGCPAGATLS